MGAKISQLFEKSDCKKYKKVENIKKKYTNFVYQYNSKFMRKVLLFSFLIPIIICNACSKSGSDDPNSPTSLPQIVIPLGEMRISIDGNLMSFRDGSGIFPEAAAGYTTSLRFLSIYRAVSSQDRRSLNVRATIDLDNTQTPIDVLKDIKITYTTFIGGQRTYDGQGNAIKFKLISKQNDIIQASFSGTLTNPLNTNDKVNIAEGQVNVQVRRF